MNVSTTGIAAYGSAAIASPPANGANTQRDDRQAERQAVEAAKPAGTGQFVDKKV